MTEEYMITIVNGKLVLPDSIIENKALIIKDDRILDIADNPDTVDGEVIDARGGYVTPGFIDIHSDRIEQFIQPRPTAQIDFELALKECERELLGNGITTIYHSISLLKDEFFGVSTMRNKQSVNRFSELVSSIHDREHLIHHRLHLRIEIDNLEAFDIVKDMIKQKKSPRNILHGSHPRTRTVSKY